MLKQFTLSFVFIFLTLALFGQNFNKRFGDQNCYDEGRSAVGLANGDVIVSGATNCQGGSQNWHSYLLRLDANGDTVWSKQKQLPNGQVKKTNDNHLIFLGGNNASFVYDTIYVTKTTLNGAIQWNQTFTFGSCGNNTAYDIEQTQDNGYVITGIYANQNCNNPVFNSFMAKLDKSGQLKWQQTYGMQKGDDQIFQIEEVPGGYAIFGWTENYGANGVDYWLSRIDNSGNLLWTETYGGQGDQFGYGMDYTADNGFILNGHGNNMEIIKTNSWGTMQWRKQFSQACGGQYFRVKQLHDEDFALLGSQTVNGNCKSTLIKINDDGDIRWTKHWQGRLRNFKISPNGRFLLTGFISYLPEVYAIKFDTLRSNTPDEPDDSNKYDIGQPSHSLDSVKPRSVQDLKDENIAIEGGMFNDHGEPVDQYVKEDEDQTSTSADNISSDDIIESSMIYPNPAKETATLEFPNPKDKKCNLALYNMEGKLMRTVSNITGSKIVIRKLGLSKGNYIYKLRSTQGDLYMGKLIFK